MAHTIYGKDRLLARVRRIKGQMEGIERAISEELPCAETLRQLASIRGAMNGLTLEIMEGHLREHVLGAETESDRVRGAEELIAVMRTYVK